MLIRLPYNKPNNNSQWIEDSETFYKTIVMPHKLNFSLACYVSVPSASNSLKSIRKLNFPLFKSSIHFHCCIFVDTVFF